ncbi:MAG TPA: outer membrane lipid asymmetry maintenance protein MlaD [Candidatus Binataceae bacterium]|nr:outer membrane lipid asymmetry maintenance protein MlaD [Candidatus Binataceae bacterium]
MYASRFTQALVGLFALVGIAALVYLSVRLGNVGIFPTPGYTLYANFDNISGLKTGDLVEIAGVSVGKVQAISLANYQAHVGLRINEGVPIDTDAIASVKTSGIIGDKYVSIALGPGEQDLKNGGTIRQTQSAFVLEDAIGQLINNSGGGSGSSGGNSTGNSAQSGSGGNCNCSAQTSSKK